MNFFLGSILHIKIEKTSLKVTFRFLSENGHITILEGRLHYLRDVIILSVS